MPAFVVLPADSNISGTLQLLKAENSRSAIVDTAYSLFANQGYAATSMRQIAESADLALGGIYNHFSSKEAIFQAILREHHPYQSLGFLLSLDEITRTTAKILLDEFDKHPEFFNLMLVEIVEFKGKHLPELFESVLHDMPPPVSWRAFLSMLVSYQITRLLFASTMPSGTQQLSSDAFIDIFLQGILKTE